jgi:biotin carboxylase
MSRTQQATTRRIVYVSRRMTGESLRSALAIKRLDQVKLFGICEQLPDTAQAQNFADLICVSSVHDADQLIAAARILGDRHGPLHQLLTAQETLLEPVAQAGEALDLQGMSVATVQRTLNKAQLKPTLEQAGIRTARHQLITGEEDARKFVEEIGFPVVLKPLSGSGGLATWCVRTADQLGMALHLMQSSSGTIVLAEEHVVG